MKYLLLLVWLAGTATGLAAPAAPADTLPGQVRVVRTVAAYVCAELARRPASQLAALDQAGRRDYLPDLMQQAMLHDSALVRPWLQQADRQHYDRARLARTLGSAVTQQLRAVCPAAKPLFEAQAPPAGTGLIFFLDPADRAALRPVAAAICTQLQHEQRSRPFASLSGSQRETHLTELFRQQLRVHRPALLRHFPAAQLAALARQHDSGGQLHALLLLETNCAALLQQVAQDAPGQPSGKP